MLMVMILLLSFTPVIIFATNELLTQHKELKRLEILVILGRGDLL